MTPGPKRGYVIGGAAVLTAAGLLGALWLWSWAFAVRQRSQHVGRLERLLAKKPPLDLVVRAFEDERSPLVAAADTPAQLEEVVRRLAGDRRDQVLPEARLWPRTRVFRASDVLYFVYFDAEDAMSGFTVFSP